MMFKQTALITFSPNASERERSDLSIAIGQIVRADVSVLTPTVPASYMGGDVVWHLHFADRQVWEDSAAQDALDMISGHAAVARLDAVAYEPSRYAVTQPFLRNGIYRALFVSVAAGVDRESVKRFEDDLAAMPDYIPEILNSAMNPTVYSRGDVPWTHVWEQEFADIGGLVGPYMMSAYHWGWVDRWFDPEMPERIVDDRFLRHSASILEVSVMASYGEAI